MTLPTWYTRPIFISSTFKDFHAERDLLQNKVFPELEERLKAYAQSVIPLDLRWGINIAGADNESEREARILQVCLSEIKRSRPFLVVFLGDRYGWIPPLDTLNKAAQIENLKLENEISVTELEINYGAFQNKEKANVYFYLRNPLPYEEMSGENQKIYSDQYSEENKDLSIMKLDRLKKKIKTNFPESNIFEYSAEWDETNNKVTGLDILERKIVEDIWNGLVKELEIQQQENLTWQDQDNRSINHFISEQLQESIVPLISYKDTIGALEKSKRLWVTGESGTGKTSLFSHITHTYIKKGFTVLAHTTEYIGNEPTSYQKMLERWLYQLGVSVIDTEEIENLEEIFLRALNEKTNDFLIIIDNVEKVIPRNREKLQSLIAKLPKNISCCFISTPQQIPSGFTWYQIKQLNEKEAKQMILSYGERYSKELDSDIINLILGITDKEKIEELANIRSMKLEVNKPNSGFASQIISFYRSIKEPHPYAFGKPRWLKEVYQYLYYLDEDDFNIIDKLGVNYNENLKNFMKQKIEKIPGELTEIINLSLDRAEKIFGLEPVKCFCSMITLFRYGINEASLLEMMSIMQGNTMDNLKFASIRRYFKPYISEWRGRYLFKQSEMKDVVRNRYLSNDLTKETPNIDKDILLHEMVKNYLIQLPDDETIKWDELCSITSTVALLYVHEIIQNAKEQKVEKVLNTCNKYLKNFCGLVGIDTTELNIEKCIEVWDYLMKKVESKPFQFMTLYVSFYQYQPFLDEMLNKKVVTAPYSAREIYLSYMLGKYADDSYIDKLAFSSFNSKQFLDHDERLQEYLNLFKKIVELRGKWHRYID